MTPPMCHTTLKSPSRATIRTPPILISTCGIISRTITSSQKFQPLTGPIIGSAALGEICRTFITRPVRYAAAPMLIPAVIVICPIRFNHAHDQAHPRPPIRNAQ